MYSFRSMPLPGVWSFPGTRMKTILVVDDQPSVLETIRLLFESKAYHCLTAESAEAAEVVFRENTVDGVIVDYGLPGVDGKVLAHRLKKIKQVPVILLSGDPDLDPGGSVDLFLPKPQEPQELLQAIKRMVGPAK
jgi:DNA-binding response OmpR family regulator